MSEITAPQPVQAGPAVPTVPVRRWTPGRVATMAIGALTGIAAVLMSIGGGLALTADRAIRDDAGFLTSDSVTLTTIDGYAFTSENLQVRFGTGPDGAGRLLGDVRLRVTGTDPAVPVFVGIAPSVEVSRYLASAPHSRVTGVGDGDVSTVSVPGTSAPSAPGAERFWSDRAEGTGTQTLTWSPRSGDWTVVVMRADGAAGPSVRLDAAAQAPVVTWVSVLVLVAGLGLLLVAAVLVLVPLVRAARTPRT